MTLCISCEKSRACVSPILSELEMAGQVGRRVGEANDGDQDAVDVSGEVLLGLTLY